MENIFCENCDKSFPKNESFQQWDSIACSIQCLQVLTKKKKEELARNTQEKIEADKKLSSGGRLNGSRGCC